MSRLEAIKGKSITIGLITKRASDDLQENIEIIKSHVKNDSAIDLWVTSECFLMKNVEAYHHGTMMEALDEIDKLASDYQTSVLVGTIIEDGGYRIHERLLGESSREFSYHKAHLGSNEEKYFVPGNEVGYLDVKGFRIGLQVCIETHVNELSILHRQVGCHLVLAPFNTPYDVERRMKNWKKYLPARGYDYNMCFLATNRNGGALAVDGRGEVIGESLSDDEPLVITLSSDHFNQRIDFQKYRRPELYQWGE